MKKDGDVSQFAIVCFHAVCVGTSRVFCEFDLVVKGQVCVFAHFFTDDLSDNFPPIDESLSRTHLRGRFIHRTHTDTVLLIRILIRIFFSFFLLIRTFSTCGEEG